MLKLRYAATALTLFAALTFGSWAQSRQPPVKTRPQKAAPQRRGDEDSPIVVKVIPAEKSTDDLGRENARDQEKLAIDQGLVGLTRDLALYTKLLFLAAA